MKYGFAIFLLVIASCRPSKEKICQSIDETIRQQYEESAFRNKKSLKIHNLKTVDFKMVGEGYLDTLSLLKCKIRGRYHAKMYELKKLGFDIAAKYAETGKGIYGYTLPSDIEKVKAKQAEMIETGDSVKYYLKRESQVLTRLKKRIQDPKEYYNAKTFVKIVSDDKYIMDTLYLVLDKNLRMVAAPN